jgi:hypothetical protein
MYQRNQHFQKNQQPVRDIQLGTLGNADGRYLVNITEQKRKKEKNWKNWVR